MKIIQFETLLVPTSLGTANVQLIGLGDDSILYAWNFKEGSWEVFKERESVRPTKVDKGTK